MIPNLAERTLEALKVAYDDRDWDAIEALCAEGFVYEDRRSHLRGGRDMFLDQGRALAEQGATFRRELLAAPGDRVCLARRFAGEDATWEVEHLLVAEVDEDGAFVAFIMFDSEERAGAANELGARSSALAGAPPAVAAFITALNTADLHGIRATLDGGRYEDHRRGRPGVLHDVEDYITSLEAALAITESLVAEQARHFAEGPHGTVTLTRTTGVRDGGALELLFLSVACWDEEDVRMLAVYECEDLDAALARYEELRPRGGVTP